MPKDNNFEFNVMPPLDQDQKGSQAKPAGLRVNQKWIIAGTSFLVVLLLAVLGYFFYNRFLAGKEARKETPNILVGSPEEDRDDDNDGLTASEEKKRGTDAKKADTDGDGLADGDEVNVYNSDPLLPDTDGDGFDDGREVARGFSPVVNSLEKADSEEIKRWTEAIAKFGLHEPTKTTLKLKAGTEQQEEKTTYKNRLNGWSIEVPKVLVPREQDNGQKVGLYISGTQAEDPDVASDPMSFDVAVRVENQALDDWVNSQYQPESGYKKIEKLTIGGVNAIRLYDMPGDACPADRTFLPKNGIIIIAIWKCNQLTAFAEFYNQIVESFKFE